MAKVDGVGLERITSETVVAWYICNTEHFLQLKMSLIEEQHANNVALFKLQILQSCSYCVVSDRL